MHFLDSLTPSTVLMLAGLGLAVWFLLIRAAKKDKKESRSQINARRRRVRQSDIALPADDSRQTMYQGGQSDSFRVPRQAGTEAGPLVNHDLNTVMAYQPARAGETNSVNATGGMTTNMALGGVTSNPRDYVMVREVQEIVPAKEQPRQRQDDMEVVERDFDPGDITGQLKGA